MRNDIVGEGPSYPGGGLPASDGFGQYRIYILETLKRISTCVDSLHANVNSLSLDIDRLKVKMGFIGGIAGAIFGGLIALIVRAVSK